jgi:hypothetical protein
MLKLKMLIWLKTADLFFKTYWRTIKIKNYEESNVNTLGFCCSNNICTIKDLGEFSTIKIYDRLTVSLISSSKLLSQEIGKEVEVVNNN